MTNSTTTRLQRATIRRRGQGWRLSQPSNAPRYAGRRQPRPAAPRRRQWLAPEAGRRIFGALLAWVAVGASPSAAAIFTVGSDGTCTHTSIQSAIGASIVSGEADEIHLAVNLTLENIALDLGSFTDGIHFIGGYLTCAQSTPLWRTAIGGSGSQPIFDIFASSQITLSNLILEDTNGRALVARSDAYVQLFNVLVRDNGGGLEVRDGATLRVTDSDIDDNDLGPIAEGGGIRCEGGTLYLRRSTVERNQALDGGGLWTGLGCTAYMVENVAVLANVAEQGGGFYLTSLSRVESTELARLVVRRNGAEGFGTNSGGGVFAEGASRFDVDNARIVDNFAEFGGGIYATQGSLVRIARGSVPCSTAYCVELSGNELTISGGVVGAAAYAVNGADIVVFQASVEENRDFAGNGSPFFAVGSGSTIWLEGVRMWRNRGGELFRATTNALVRLAYVSASGNSAVSPVGRARVAHIEQGATLELNSSILWNVAGYTRLTGATIVEADCLVTNDVSENNGGAAPGVIPNLSRYAITDPRFRDPLFGDLRLALDSPAIDFCDDSRYSTWAAGDIDGETRGDDHPDVGSSPYRLFDLGFDEIVGSIFSDGFESGDDDRWSFSTQP